LYVTAVGLRLRRAFPDLFLEGDYLPLDVEPSAPARAVAFARRSGDAALIAVAPRLVAAISPRADPGPHAPCTWGDTRVFIPATLGSEFVNVLTGERVRAGDAPDGRNSIALSSLFENFPVAWLWGRT
jgi:(1->4)-alpha-D-glucan 1-alpha-D-glucosylmutase